MKIDIEALLHLSAVPGVGPNRIRALIGRFKSPEAVFRASIADLGEVEGIDRKTASNIKKYRDAGFAKQQLSLINKHSARIITFWDAEFPRLLKNIADPPAFLFIKGKFLENDDDALAVVGTRQPSDYGKIVAEKICTELAAKGLTIVSGLARGVDTEAHKTTLHAGGRTVAVLGSGIDVIYPYENEGLSKRIAKQGALVSEFPMGSAPDAPNFPRRNRLISGMALGTLVVEAGQQSGALITASVALEQNREVFAIPGSVLSSKSQGANRLIQEGAKLVQSLEDILSELRPQLTHLADRATRRASRPTLTDLEQRLLESLSHEPMHIDAIAQKHSIPTSQALTLLLSLELKDLIKQLAGKMFIRM